uniref:Ig-like domain-containing protein n=1 Tax=Xenopus tropicalis TaxID=8364 RepID=A0A803JHG6_XENTR
GDKVGREGKVSAVKNILCHTLRMELHLTAKCALSGHSIHDSITPTGYIHWYRLEPSQGPQYLVSGFKDTVSGFHTMTFSKDRKSSELHIQNMKPEESGVYLCALSDTAVQPNAPSVQYVDTV